MYFLVQSSIINNQLWWNTSPWSLFFILFCTILYPLPPLLLILVCSLLIFARKKNRKRDKGEKGIHTPTSYRYSRINNELWWNASSSYFYFSSCYTNIDRFLPPLDIFSPSLVISGTENKKVNRTKMSHTYQQFT